MTSPEREFDTSRCVEPLGSLAPLRPVTTAEMTGMGIDMSTGQTRTSGAQLWVDMCDGMDPDRQGLHFHQCHPTVVSSLPHFS